MNKLQITHVFIKKKEGKTGVKMLLKETLSQTLLMHATFKDGRQTVIFRIF